MINYTQNQLEAINYFDSDLIISASAGSGKTQVLLEKVVNLISKGYKIEDMLVVTFTNLASSEMKTKLENMLEAKFCETKDIKFFDALKDLNTSDISTIHSFCQKIIKKYYYCINVDPNFEIKDDNFLFYLKNLALDQTFKQFLNTQDEEFVNLSNLFVFKRDYKLFKEEILAFYEFLVSKPNKYDFIKNIINQNYETNIDKNVLFDKFRVYCQKVFENLKQQVLCLKTKSNQISNEKLDFLCDEILNLMNFDFSTSQKFIKTFLNDFVFPRIMISSKSEVEAVMLKEDLQKCVKQIKDFVKEIKSVFCFEKIEDLNVDIEKSKKLLIKFVEVVETFEENFKNMKLKYNCLDFNDLEVLTLKLFENQSVLNEISKKYKFIFVDEYQDTNLVQEEILQKISKNSKRIMVGDLKQSIYAFRECNPKILNDKMKDFKTNNLGKVIELNKNFRSRFEILDFSNNIFSNLMRKENCDYEYKTSGMFVCGRKEESDDKTPIEILALNKESENFEQLKHNENLLVLNAINNLLEKTIVENGVRRKLTYSDIAIISRKRSAKFNSLCKFLEENKVPTNVKFFEKIYSSFEVKLIFAYLKLINNFDDDIALVSVLKNIYDFSDNEIITIKTNTTLIKSVLNYNKNDEILKKINKFFEDLHKFESLAFEKDVKSLILEIIKQTKLDLILLKHFGKISASRLEVFLTSIQENQFNLNEFLNYSSKIVDKNFEVRKVDGENSVVCDTFHSTKGLEYNAVIIAFAGDGIFSKNKSNLIYNANLGVGIYNFDEENRTKSPNIVYSMIKILNRQEEFNEESRLCYVALTRAKNFMTICGVEKASNLKTETNPLNFLSFSSYLSLICSNGLKNYVNLQIVDEKSNLFKNENDDLQKEKANEIINLDYKVFDNLFNKEYSFNSSEFIQLKNSVTSLSEEDNLIYNITNFKVTDNDNEDYIAVGNAYHHTFEKLPFSLKSKVEVHNKIISLIENGELEENVYSYIDDEKIFKAISQISKLIDKNDKIFKEKVFLMNIKYKDIVGKNIDDKILIQGIIDLMVEKEDEIILIDYKTSRLNDINLIKKYSLQLSLYEKAISEKFAGKKISKFIYSIFLDKLINVV